MCNLFVSDFNITTNGLSINYTSGSIPKSLNLNQAEACRLLVLVGYIRKYRYKKGEIVVLIDITEDMVSGSEIKTIKAGRMEVTWDYFSRNYDLDEVWAAEIVEAYEVNESVFVGI